MSSGGSNSNYEKAGLYKWGQIILGFRYQWGLQDSILAPLLSVMCINDLDSEITSKVSKFADGVKIGRTTNGKQDYQILQN